MTTDVTDVIQRYRLALRYIWNSCIWVEPRLRDWSSVYSFHELKKPLFMALVSDPLDLECVEYFGNSFKVIPDMRTGVGLSSLQVNSRLPGAPEGGIWELLNGPFDAKDVDLTLLDLFDWTLMDYIDLRYYIVAINSCQTHPNIVGHHALVDVTQARIFLGVADTKTNLEGLPG